MDRSVVRVKICGLTRKDDALAAAELGADALGFIFYDRSPRAATPETVRALACELPPYVTRVGVFVDTPAPEIVRIMRYCRLHVAQLHGDQTTEIAGQIGYDFIKAFRLRAAEDLERLKDFGDASAFLLDTFDADQMGGTGRTFNWDWAISAKNYGRPIILSGGLTPENVAEAVVRVGPAAVDVASGVEASPGKKDLGKVARFIEAAKGAE